MQDESTCLGTANTSTFAMGKQLFVRVLSAVSTLIAGGLIFLIKGHVDIYEVIFKATGIILGTLVAIYILGKSKCFQQEQEKLFFSNRLPIE